MDHEGRVTVRPIATSGALFAAVVLASGVASVGSVRAQTAAAVPVGSPRDGLATAVAEASRRFGIPAEWILAVMRVESAGDTHAMSRAGAIGLMQVMPTTYAELRRDLGLGPDPFAVRDNVLAGTAYLRRMYDRYGSPGFLAAYNAGPGRWEAHLSGVRPLPAETSPVMSKGSRRSPDRRPSPTQETRRHRFLHPPFTAPLFVARNVERRAPNPPGERDRIAALLASNTTVVRPSDLLFPVETPADTPQSSDTAKASDRITDPSSGDALFVPRTASRAPR